MAYIGNVLARAEVPESTQLDEDAPDAPSTPIVWVDPRGAKLSAEPIGVVPVQIMVVMLDPVRFSLIACRREADQRPCELVVVDVATNVPSDRYTESFVGPVMWLMALTELVDPMACQVIVEPLYVAPFACMFTKVS
jgi:hypothetical protein